MSPQAAGSSGGMSVSPRRRPSPSTDGDSALGASTSPDMRGDEFSDEREESFECFGESGGREFQR